MQSFEVGTSPTYPFKRSSFREVMIALTLSWVLIPVVAWLPGFIPFLAPYSSSLIAALFVYIPVLVVWRQRDLPAALGMRWKASGGALATGGAVVLTIFALFIAGFFLYQHLIYQRSPVMDAAVLQEIPLQYDLDSLEDLPKALVVGRIRPHQLVVVNNSGAPRKVGVTGVGGEVTLKTWSTDPAGNGLALKRLANQTVVLQSGELLAARWTGQIDALHVDGDGEIQIARTGDATSLPLEAHPGLLWLLSLLFLQLVAVALPEELFYRGFLQPRLAQLLPGRLQILGADFGPSVWLTSALFAVGHVLTIPQPGRLAVFFPSLMFGWLANKTGSIWLSVLVHALSNVLLTVLYRFIGV